MGVDPRKAAFDGVRQVCPKNPFNDPGNIHAMHNLLDAFGAPREQEFDREAFCERYINKIAPAITSDDIEIAASRLRTTPQHIRALMKVESNGTSFDDKGRPIILPEPHIFYRLTEGRHGVTRFSYPKWGQRPYPKSYDARWDVLADMACWDEDAALQSASWGLFQVMGFHWKICGYSTPQAFAQAMAADEDNHLEAMVAFIDAEDLEGELRMCQPGDPESCRAFCRGYNGPGYAKHGYHIKFAMALT